VLVVRSPTHRAIALLATERALSAASDLAAADFLAYIRVLGSLASAKRPRRHL